MLEAVSLAKQATDEQVTCLRIYADAMGRWRAITDRSFGAGGLRLHRCQLGLRNRCVRHTIGDRLIVVAGPSTGDATSERQFLSGAPRHRRGIAALTYAHLRVLPNRGTKSARMR
jgi:hypothetical protein